MRKISAAYAPQEEMLSAVITRATGRVENRGVISYRGPNPAKRLAWGVWIWIKAQYWTRRERRYLKEHQT